MSLPWKGNVRELDNVIEHTMILAEGDHITLKDLPAAIVVTSGQTNPVFTYNLKDALRHFERQHITRVLDQVGQDRREAAKLLFSVPQDRRIRDRLTNLSIRASARRSLVSFASEKLLSKFWKRPALFSLGWDPVCTFIKCFRDGIVFAKPNQGNNM